jgi:hypothetical protein
VVLARVVTINGETVLTAAATGVVTDGKVAINRCLLAQCISGGRYSFYTPSAPIGFISGDVFKAGVPASGVHVTVDGLPFKTLTDASGHFEVVVLSGTYTLNASEPDTGLVASAEGTISGGENIIVNLSLTPAELWVSSVVPHDKAAAVDPAVSVEAVFSEPVDPLTVTYTSFEVLLEQPGIHKDSVPLEGRISITSGNTSAVFTPEFELEPGAIYRVRLSGDITDGFGSPLAPFESVFTTAEVLGIEALEPGELEAGLPDENGYVTVRGGPGIAAPGTPVRVINLSQSIVLTITAEDDGSFTGMVLAVIGDEIVAEVRDYLGNVTTLSVGLLTDGQGSTAVGPEGGTIYGPGGIEAFVPEGAFDEYIVMHVAVVSPDVVQNVTVDPALELVGALQIDTGGVTANKELKVSVPAPEWVTLDHQLLLTRVVNIRGYDELTLTSPAVLEDGRIYNTTPPFESIYTGGKYIIYNTTTGVGFAMVGTWNAYHTDSYIAAAIGLVFDVPFNDIKVFPVTVPVDKPFTITLSDNDGTPLDSVTIQGPPTKGEFTGDTTYVTDDNVPPVIKLTSISDGALDIVRN